MNAAEYIRENVLMTDVIRKYGFNTNRTGFISCPFHSEKTASLKIFPNKRGWHCFGCETGGSVIDFVERLFGTDFSGAIKIINDDFDLGLPIGRKSTFRERETLRKRINELEMQRLKEREEREASKKKYEYWLNEYICAEIIISALKPKTPDDALDENYVNAMHKMPIINHILDCLTG